MTSVVRDHTSILAMFERKWNLPAMTHRDAAADLSDFLDFSGSAFAEPPQLAPPLAGPAQLACEKSGPGQIPPPGSVTRLAGAAAFAIAGHQPLGRHQLGGVH